MTSLEPWWESLARSGMFPAPEVLSGRGEAASSEVVVIQRGKGGGFPGPWGTPGAGVGSAAWLSR